MKQRVMRKIGYRCVFRKSIWGWSKRRGLHFWARDRLIPLDIAPMNFELRVRFFPFGVVAPDVGKGAGNMMSGQGQRRKRRRALRGTSANGR
jgi:hypothetical protein